jgi:protein gp37
MPWKHDKHLGPIRLVEKELSVNYGTGRRIFAEHCNDLFAAAIPDEFIRRILAHCCRYPENMYLYHSKNPARYADYLDVMPPDHVLGTTAETNRSTAGISLAPAPLDRLAAMSGLAGRKLVTVEPLLEFDLNPFVAAILQSKPDHVILGADSKFRGLREPTRRDVVALLDALRAAGLDVWEKPNLQRLLG